MGGHQWNPGNRPWTVDCYFHPIGQDVKTADQTLEGHQKNQGTHQLKVA